MTTGNTALLGLALPVEGELDGTWGDTVNDSITSLVDSAVAGTTTLSTDTDVTLTTTALAANQARQAILLWTASNGATTRNITAPAQSKPYIVINAGTGSVVLRGAGPTTGVTIVSGEKCLAAWNGSDFVKVSTSTAGSGDVVGPASSTDNAFARFDSTTGKLLQNSTGATLNDTGAPSFTGSVNVAGTSSSGAAVVLAEDTDNGTNTVTLSAASSIATSFELKLPNADGTTGQAIVTDGSGNLSFSSTGDVTLSGTQTLTNKTLTDPKLLLAGTNGTAGQVPVSQGAGLPPVWGAVGSPEIKTPTNVSPATGATNIGATPALTGSTFYSLYGVAMAASQWQVSTVSDFASTVVSTGDVAGTAVTYNVASGVLSVSTLYYWRVRYKDANGVYSEWSTATTFTTAASFGPTTIGEAYGGGYYAGKIVQGGSTYYLIVAPKSSGENSSKQWKTSNDAGPSATITLNNGPAASSSMNSASYPAAQFCEGLSIGGYTDWYLPARDELELCYRNLKPTTTANNTSARSQSSYTYPEGNDVSGDTMGINRNSNPTGAAYTSSVPAQTSVTLFQAGNSEAFAAAYYWSSSEYSATNAWRQTFDTGNQANGSKDLSYYVRAVRRLPV
jgi:hypothetical protein